ncbi:hypothetical protein V8F33_004872 [Rhypophila sp. PSN 637]
MDALGGISSVITILDLAWKIKSLRVAVKDAPADWQRYCNGLQAVASIGNAIESVYLNYPGTNEISIPSKGSENPQSLLEHLNKVLDTAIKDANILLAVHSQPNVVGRIRDFFVRIKFVFDKDKIEGLIKRVEATRQQLHMTLTLVSLHTNASWQREVSGVLRTVQDGIAKHLELLEALQHSTPPLSAEMIRVEIEESSRLGGAEALSSKPGVLSNMNLVRRGKKKHCAHASHSSESAQPSKHSADRRVGHGDDTDAGDEKDDSGPDTDESEIDEEPASQDNRGMTRDGVCAPDPGPNYGILLVDTELMQVPVDSEIYQSAIGSEGSHSSPLSGPVTSLAPIRLEEVLDTFSDAEWDHVKYLPAEELMEFLTSAGPTAYATDVEMPERDQSSSPIAISCHRESYLLVSGAVNLHSCRRDGGSRARNFCIDRVSIKQNTQAFCAKEPCINQGRRGCRHITIEVEDGDVFKEGELLLQRVKLAWLTIGEPLGNELNGLTGRQKDTVLSLRCSGGRQRNKVGGRAHPHTVIDDDGRTACALQAKLFASPETPFGESYADTERVPSDAVDGDAAHTGDNVGENVAGDDDGLPDSPGLGDDGPALEWLRMVALDDTYEPPESIELGALIRFLYLIDRHRQYEGARPLKQARVWASKIQLPDFPNEDDIPQLWVMWKLGMEHEFKSLSATIQQHARSPLSQWQDGPRNEHAIQLPRQILEKLDNGRSQALSTVRDKIAEEIEKQRRIFANSVHAGVLHDDVRGPFCHSPIEDVLRSSFTFGYLQLQIDRFLQPWRSGQDISDLDILGLSFIDVVRCVLSMLELDGWNLCTVPNGIRTPSLLEKATLIGVPILLGMLGSFVPVPGFDLHNGCRLHVPLDRGFKAELVTLVLQVGQQCWGVDINGIEE